MAATTNPPPASSTRPRANPRGDDPANHKTWLIEQIAELLSLPRRSLSPHAPLREQGLDSSGAVALATALERRLGRRVPVSTIYEHSSLVDLLAWIERDAGAGAGADAATTADRDRGAARSDEDDAREPIAVIGMACRLPGGVESPEDFWRLLQAGEDAIIEVPEDRWDRDAFFSEDARAPGRMNTRRGGFLRGPIDRFDAGFFGVSPREAAQIDPQQRLALELAWEALERAGLAARELRGTRAGVFMGAVFNDYAALRHKLGPELITAHTSTGQNQAVIANRISYTLGLQGPSVTVNTACSSSLVAIHLACQSLRAGESTVALAGGVHLMLTPDTSVAVAKFGALAPDGRCKSFDARADGYARGEGGGLVVLKRLSAALRDGDPILCTILGSATNNDGASNGLTAPNPAAQRAVIEAALRRADISAASVDYVEAHGTGTALGDPIEASALGSVYGAARSARPDAPPLQLGTCKTNIGHLEAAAGVAGFIKAALCLQRRRLVKNLHFETPNPHIDFAALNLEVVTRARAWTRDRVEDARAGSDRAPPRAAVSSFGYGGTNAHVILEAAAPPRPHIASFAHSSARALQRAARALAWPRAGGDEGTRDEDAPRLICAREPDPASNRASVRAAVVAGDHEVFAAELRALAAGDAKAIACPPRQVPNSVSPIFVFAGLGAQWLGMGRELLTGEPVFREALQRCDRIARALGGPALIDALVAPRARSRLEDPDAHDLLNPLLVALQIATAALWAAHGVRPAAVVGHSIGEIAAAQVAGALSLEDAMRVAIAVGDAYRACAREGDGALALVNRSADDVRDAIARGRGLSEQVRVAGANDPRSTLVCGPRAATARLREQLVAAEEQHDAKDMGGALRFTELSGVYSHCPAVAPYAETLTDALAELRAAPLRVAMHSTVNFQRLRGPELNAAYWIRNMSSPVRFAERIAGLAAAGHRCFLELSPAATLRGAIERSLPEGTRAAVVASQRRGPGGREDFWRALAELHTRGVAVRWRARADAWEGETEAAGELAAVAAPAVEPSDAETGADAETPELFVLSARDPRALKALAGATAQALRRPPVRSLAALCIASAQGRERHTHRAAIVVRSVPELARALTGLAAGEPGPTCLSGQVTGAPPRVALLFSSADERLASTEARARGWDELAALAARFSVIRALASPQTWTRARAAGPGGLALLRGVLLARLWRALGVEPTLLLGFGAGLLAARCVAGTCSIEQAIAALEDPATRPKPASTGDALPVLAGPAAAAALRAQGPERAVDLALLIDPCPHPSRPGDVELLPAMASAPSSTARDAAVTGALLTLAALELRGLSINWRAAHAGRACERAELPTYPFTRRRHWLAAAPARLRATGTGDARDDAVVHLPGPAPSLLAAHRLDGVPIAPGAWQLCAVLEQLQVNADPGPGQVAPPRELANVRFNRALAREGGELRLERRRGVLRLGPRDEDGRPGDGPLLTARARHGGAEQRPPAQRPGDLRHAGRTLKPTAIYCWLAGLGLELEPSLQRLERLWWLEGDAGVLARIRVDGPADPGQDTDDDSTLSVATVDACFQTIALACALASTDDRAPDRWEPDGDAHIIPHVIERVIVYPPEPAGPRDLTAARWCLARPRGSSVGDAVLLDERGVALMTIRGLQLQPVSRLRARRLSPRRPSRAALTRAVEQRVRAAVASVLDHEDPDALERETPLRELGLDSMMAVELVDELGEQLAELMPAPPAGAEAEPLPTTLVYEHVTLTALTRALVERVRRARVNDEPGAAEPAEREDVEPARVQVTSPSREPANDEAIAVVGIGCRFPGGADSPAALWRMLLAGRDAIGVVPRGRWPAVGATELDPSCRRGGFLANVEQFDARFFNVPARAARSLDPQQRLLLEVTWEALEHAGIPADRLRGTRTGVYLGISTMDYGRRLLAELPTIDAYTGTGSLASVAAGRVAYTLGLEGPAMAIDTACSSSLLSIHLACSGLRAGECETALAGGVNLILDPALTLAFHRLEALAPDGRCRSFAEDARGYVRSEGCGVVVLKRLVDAARDGDRVLALVRGSASNQDGRSNGLTAPSERAQVEVIDAALRRAGVDAAAVDYVEAHGTGTPLGDPIELRALSRAYGAGRGDARPLQLGSIKSNIGHAEAAAGVAGFIKATLALAHAQLPASLHSERPTQHIQWERSKLQLVRRATPWPEGQFAGVSAFGIGGTNVHAVLERGPEKHDRKDISLSAGPLPLLTLSAKDAPGLRELVRRYVAALSETSAAPEPRALVDLCYTSNTGRQHFDAPHRLAFYVEPPVTRARLRDALTAWLARRGDPGATPSPRAAEAGGAQEPVPLATLVTGDAVVVRASQVREASRAAPELRATLSRCAAIIEEIATKARTPRDPGHERLAHLLAWLRSACEDASPEDGARDETHTPMASACVTLALASQWRAWGVAPTRAIGDGLGVLIAANVAGALALAPCLQGLLQAHGMWPQNLTVADLPDPDDADETPAALDACTLHRTRRPGPTLGSPLAAGTLADARRLLRKDGLYTLTLSPELLAEAPATRFAESLAELYIAGATLRWDRYLAPLDPQRCSAPTYPFQRDRFWLEGHPRSRARGSQHAAQPTSQGSTRAVLERLVEDGEALTQQIATQSLSAGERAALSTLPSLLKRVALALRSHAGDASRLQIHPQPRNLEDRVTPGPVMREQQREQREQREPPQRARRPAARDADVTRRSVRAALQRHVAALLELDLEPARAPGAVDPDRGFFDLGMDSLMIAELHGLLLREFAVELPISALFDHPTINQLAGLVAPEVSARSGPVVATQASRTTIDTPTDTRCLPQSPPDAAPGAAPEPSLELSEEDAIELIARKFTSPE